MRWISPAASLTWGYNTMIVLGLILLILGFLAHIAILWTIGVVVLVIGVILALVGMAGREVGGRRHWF